MSLLRAAVVYLCEHSERGALGLIINKPSDITSTPFRQGGPVLAPRRPVADEPVFQGGPVQTERGFVLHEPMLAGTAKRADESAYALDHDHSRRPGDDHLQGCAGSPVHRRGPARVLVTLGYSSWGEGQLESELAENAWLTVGADLR
jgi:putative transcriptional regulator